LLQNLTFYICEAPLPLIFNSISCGHPSWAERVNPIWKTWHWWPTFPLPLIASSVSFRFVLSMWISWFLPCLVLYLEAFRALILQVGNQWRTLTVVTVHHIAKWQVGTSPSPRPRVHIKKDSLPSSSCILLI
jgi:hypothetical protein